ncbi:MAG: hypothetical protein AB8G99_13625 [Planctomycetaceae bacterium]
MSESANVQSIEAIRDFEGALMKFYDVASRSTSSMQQQSQKMLQWLELDRPVFWKRQVELCHQRLAEARTRLTQCMMRRTGDFKPSCYDEKKAMAKAKVELEFARNQLQVVKKWIVKARSESEEFTGRQAQLQRLLEGDVPRMCALLQRIVGKLETYASLTTDDTMAIVSSSLEDDGDLDSVSSQRDVSESNEDAGVEPVTEEVPTGDEE